MAKLTPQGLYEKQELFCQKFIELKGNASEAYRQSYSAKNMSENAIGVEAKRLKDNPKISLRISELQSKHARRHDVTVDSLIAELDEIKKIALQQETPQTSSAVSAVMGKAKILGFDKQVHEVTGKDGTPIAHTHSVTLDEILQARSKILDDY